MNKIYRTVYNETTGTWTAVAETATAKGKSSKNSNVVAMGFKPTTFVLTAFLGTLICFSKFAAADYKAGLTTAPADTKGRSIVIGGSNGDSRNDPSTITITNPQWQLDTVAIGDKVKVEVTDNSAGHTGFGRTQFWSGMTAIGSNAHIKTDSSSGEKFYTPTAIGGYTKAYGDGAVAIGESAHADGMAGVAIGTETYAKMRSLATGFQAKAEDQSAIAIGDNTQAKKQNAIAIGKNAQATGKDSIAIGTGNIVSDQSSGAIGNENTVNAQNTMVLGNGITATQANSVFLGNASDGTAVLKPINSATVNNISYSGFAGVSAAENGVVSIGSAGKERQIKHVAAGEISRNSTDAINGSQLYIVADELSKRINNTAGSDTITVVQSEDKSITIKSKDKDAQGNAVYDIAVSKAELTPRTDGKVTNQNPAGTANGFVTGDDVADAINNSGFIATASASSGTVSGEKEQLIKAGETVTFDAGKNIEITQADGKFTFATKDQQTLGEKADPAAGKDGVDGSIGVNGKDGSAVAINGKDGSIGLNGKDGKDGLSLKSSNGVQDVDGTNGTNGLPGTSGKTRLVYQPTNPDGSNNGDPEQIATLKDGLLFTGNNEDTMNRHKLNTLVKVRGEGVDKTASKTFQSAAGNINVKANGSDVLEIQLNKDLKNIDSIAINNGPTINDNGIDMAGDKITNLGDNLPTTTNQTNNQAAPSNVAGNNAATVNDVLNAGWNLQGNSTAKDFVRPYDTVNVIDGKGTTAVVTSNGTVSSIQYDVKVDDKTITIGNDGKLTVNTDNLPKTKDTVTIVQSEDKSVAVVKKDNDQNGNTVYDIAVSTADLTTNPDGSVTNNKAGNTFVTGDDVADAINNSGFILTTSASAGEVEGNTNELVNPGETVTIDAGKNVRVTQAAGKITVATKDDVEFTSVKAGNTTLNNDGLTIANGPSVTNTGINAGDKKITNVAAGTNDTDAVNVKQLKDSRTTVQSSDNSISVTQTEKDGHFDYDIKVNNQGIVNNAQLPVVYTDKNGNKVYKQHDGSFNTAVDGKGNTVQNGDVIASMQNADGSTTTPTTLTNVASNLPTTNNTDAYNTTGAPVTTEQKLPENVKLSNAATVGDVLNSGWNLQGNGEAKDFVKPYDTVNFVNGTGTTAKVTTNKEGTSTNVTFDVNTDGTTITTKEVTDASGNKTTQITANTTTLTDANKDGKVDTPSDADKGKLVNAGDIANAINNSGFTLTTSASAGEVEGNTNELVNPGETVTIDAGKNVKVTQAAGKITVATKDNVEFTSVKTGNTTLNNDGLTIANGPSVTNTGINAGDKKITNVAPGEISATSTDAVNGSQLHATNTAINNINGNVNQLNNRINDVSDRADAGTASAMASAGLPQAYLPGKSMVAVAGSTYRGKQGYAVGFSAISDGGNWIVKGIVNGNSRGHFGATIGAGYQW